MSSVIIQDYDTLCQAVADEMDRADLAERIPGWVFLGHQRIARDVSRKLLKTTFTINAAEVAIPAGVKSIETIRLVSGEPEKDDPMEPTTIAGIDEYRATMGNVAARPKRFAVRSEGSGAGTIMFAPQPDQSYTGQLIYIPSLPALGSATPANVILTDAPDLYLAATMVWASSWLKDGEEDKWEGVYGRALASVRVTEQRELYPGGFPAARLGRVF